MGKKDRNKKKGTGGKSNNTNSKASQLKTLRQLFEKLNKTDYDLPSDVVALTTTTTSASASSTTTTSKIQADVTSWLKKSTTATTTNSMKKGSRDVGNDTENVENNAKIDSSTSIPSPPLPSSVSSESTRLTLHSMSSKDLQQQQRQASASATANQEDGGEHRTSTSTTSVFEQIVELFSTNMSQQYKSSSWGFDLDSKRDELSHFRARYLVLLASSSSSSPSSNDDDDDESNERQQQDELVGFCHYRWEYDDDDEPTEVVLYVYELQIDPKYHRRGLGQHLMNVIEQFVLSTRTTDKDDKTTSTSTSSTTSKGSSTNNNSVNKVMLTVFKSNMNAMDFYTKRLQYKIDDSSPSRHGLLSEDYEILSKVLI